jgi:hypothetical protein|tara:strand:+ start:302 stop:742 length:441 start_codon:yes stop_codon:yes gene_type:complete
MVGFSKLYIFIYVMLLIGCNSQTGLMNCEYSYLDISAPSLEQDENGYYHMEFLDNYIQTFSTLNAETGLSYEKISWITDKQYNVEYMGINNWVYLVNTDSYTDREGIAHTVLGVWEDFIGDTIKVYCGYVDNCQITYVDSLGVIVE